MSKLTQFDLCSGVGAGFPLAGIKLEEFELVGLSELDPWCQGILFTRFPQIPIYSDVRILPRLTNIDVITASPACQPFSIQGKRRGAVDERDCLPAVLNAIAQL